MATIIIPDALVNAIYAVWTQIASDYCQAVAECGEDARISKEECVEACIDADRLTSFGHAEQDATFHTLLKTHGYDALFAELCKRCDLEC